MHAHALLSPLGAATGYLGAWANAVEVSRYLERAEQFLGLVQARVDGHMRLALTYLEQGNVPSATHHLKQALESKEFPEPLPAQRQAAEYLRAIDRATGGRGTGP